MPCEIYKIRLPRNRKLRLGAFVGGKTLRQSLEERSLLEYSWKQPSVQEKESRNRQREILFTKVISVRPQLTDGGFQLRSPFRVINPGCGEGLSTIPSCHCYRIPDAAI